MTTNKLILGFIGEIAAGKSTVTKYLTERYGCNSYRFSDMLRDMLKRIYVEENRANIQAVSIFIRTTYGQDIMSRVLAKDVVGDANDLVIVEGVRRPTDITYLKELPGFHLVYITADQKTRWERPTQRRENPDDAEKTFEQFQKDEGVETEQLIASLGKQAEDTIINNGTKEELFATIDALLSKYGHQN